MKIPKVYVASSWRNSLQESVVAALKQCGYEVYDFKNPAPGNHGFHWSEIDPEWQSWTPEQFRHHLSEHPLTDQGFGFDMAALAECDICVLVLPCGRSAHLEAGYAIGAGKETIILLSPGDEPELMYKMTPYICTSMAEVIQCLTQITEEQPDEVDRLQDLEHCHKVIVEQINEICGFKEILREVQHLLRNTPEGIIWKDVSPELKRRIKAALRP